MATSAAFLPPKPKAHKNFYVVLNEPPGGAFVDGSTISGECILLSSHNEDVGEIFVVVQGVLKTAVEKFHPNNNTQPNQEWHCSESILIDLKKTVYAGGPKLAKKVTYRWPFEFVLPDGLLPPGKFEAKGGWLSNLSGHASVAYEVAAVRGRTWQKPESLRRQFTFDDRFANLPVQPCKITEKLGGFTGMVAQAPLLVKRTPPSPPDYTLRPQQRDHEISVPLSQPGQAPQGFLHGGQQHDFDARFSVAVQLPRTLVQWSAFPILVGSSFTAPETPPATLLAVEADLVAKTTIKSTGGYCATGASRIHIFHAQHMAMPLPTNATADLRDVLPYKLDVQVAGNFSHELLEVKYDLEVEVKVCCGDKTFKDKFVSEDVDVVT